ncbi:MAG: HPr family phosphocarrier protein [Alphaproteobacteria bacterium CG_4_10_14_0_2_um_filter_63_37]|nr:MAG: phosphocarrier protein HPr [Proteobacteria bacterium CG1_02_64_396]PJA25031.1 MAG: HPr family phosphocarrier protein [Alphaproteobacteria bacterium CG_4_10_14_0_2_um_filter_63_37]
MREATLHIVNRLGLHARASARFVQEASRFKSQVFLKKGDIEINAKSILGVMMLAAGPGSELTLRVEGEDEEQTVEALAALVANRFGEEQ